MKTKDGARVGEMRSEYKLDYSTAIRGKYYRRLLKEGANVVILDPDVAKVFRDSAAVNDALRGLLRSSARSGRTGRRARTKARTRRTTTSRT